MPDEASLKCFVVNCHRNHMTNAVFPTELDLICGGVVWCLGGGGIDDNKKGLNI